MSYHNDLGGGWKPAFAHLVRGGLDCFSRGETDFLRKPVLVMREVTERVEGVDAGTAQLVGTETTVIMENTRRLLDSTMVMLATVMT